jgi:hypothetical protein
VGTAGVGPGGAVLDFGALRLEEGEVLWEWGFQVPPIGGGGASSPDERDLVMQE